MFKILLVTDFIIRLMSYSCIDCWWMVSECNINNKENCERSDRLCNTSLVEVSTQWPFVSEADPQYKKPSVRH